MAEPSVPRGPVEIDGFRCELHDGPDDVVIREAICIHSGRVATHVPGRWTAIYTPVPPSVLAWLVAPLIDEGYARGKKEASRPSPDEGDPLPGDFDNDPYCMLDDEDPADP